MMAQHDLCFRWQLCAGEMYGDPLPIVERCGKGVRLQGRRMAYGRRVRAPRYTWSTYSASARLGVLSGPGPDQADFARWPDASGGPRRMALEVLGRWGFPEGGKAIGASASVCATSARLVMGRCGALPFAKSPPTQTSRVVLNSGHVAGRPLTRRGARAPTATTCSRSSRFAYTTACRSTSGLTSTPCGG